MNGFTDTILTLLLSWMRMLVNDLWRLFTSEDGGALYRFLVANWKIIVLILCVGGFVADRLIYLIRWRPYYVWFSRLGRRRARPEAAPEEEPLPMGWEQEAAGEDAQEPVWPLEAELATSGPAPQAAFPTGEQATVQYAPTGWGTRAEYAPYLPPEGLEPVFDEPEDDWAHGDALVQSLWEDPAMKLDASFGAPKPEPIHYIRDMQAGFARPRPPEELYAPPRAAAPAVPAEQQPAPLQEPVHPGLDAEAFRERFGLTAPPPLAPAARSELGEEAAYEAPAYDCAEEPEDAPVMQPPVFRPFTMRQEAAPERAGTLKRLARRARDLVGVEDEEHRPTIHDLQSTVDVTRAFHDPVYPQQRDQKGGGG